MKPILCAGPGPHDAGNGVIGQADDPAPTLKAFCTSSACQAAAQGYTG